MPQAAERTGLHFFPEMLPAWQESSLDVHISCWSLCRARGPRGVAASGEKGMLCGLRWVASFPSCSSWGDLGLTSSCLLLRSEAPQECDRGLVWPAGPSLMRPFPPEAWMALVPSSPSPQPRALLGRPGLKLPPHIEDRPRAAAPFILHAVWSGSTCQGESSRSPGGHSLVGPSVLFLRYSVLLPQLNSLLPELPAPEGAGKAPTFTTCRCPHPRDTVWKGCPGPHLGSFYPRGGAPDTADRGGSCGPWGSIWILRKVGNGGGWFGLLCPHGPAGAGSQE